MVIPHPQKYHYEFLYESGARIVISAETFDRCFDIARKERSRFGDIMRVYPVAHIVDQ